MRHLRAGLPGGGDLCEDDVPGQWAQFTAGNASFFDPLGSPGSASKTGPLPCDTDHGASCVTSR
jgi:hypothetical protein